MRIKDDDAGDRLRKAREKAGFESAADAARRFGWNAVTYRAHENGQNGFNSVQASRYATAYGVDLNWLVSGSTVILELEDESQIQNVVSPSGIVRIPRFRVQLSAGPGSDIFDEKRDGSIPFADDFFQKKLGRVGHAGLFVLDVAGDSMEPTIPKGSIVMIDTQEKVPDGSIMAFREGEFAYVKRLTKTSDGFEATSDNPALPNRTRAIRPADNDEFQIFGRVCWVAHSL